MAKKAARKRAPTRADILAYQHDQRRVNNPEVGMVDPDLDPAKTPTGGGTTRTSIRHCSST